MAWFSGRTMGTPLKVLEAWYNTDLFDEATITRMLGYFKTLLEGIVANPQELQTCHS